MVRFFTIVLTTILISIITKGNTQDFTASISGKQNVVVLAPDRDIVSSHPENDSANNNFDFICGQSKINFNGITYNTVNVNGKCWLDRNLGAKRAAKYPKDKESFGDYYQWGRLADGHEKTASFPTILLSEVDNPGFAGFITTTTPPYDWHVPQNDNLWDSPENNPCPEGWHVATKDDFDILLSKNNATELFKSPLKIPFAGYRNGKTGYLNETGNNIFLWTSDSSGKKAFGLEAGNNQVKQKRFARANGMPVRCVKSE